MTTKYRVGVIGHTGKGNYGHGLDRVWLELPDCEVVAVADPDESGRAATAKTAFREERVCRLCEDAR